MKVETERQKTGLIQEKVSPELLAKLEFQYPNIYFALTDLIDNSYDARREGEPVLIHLNFDQDSLSISDYGGWGMGLEDLENFFHWGFSGKRQRLGRYGYGGKASLEYCAKGFTLKCSKYGENKYFTIKQPDWGDRSEGFKQIEYQEHHRHPGHGFVEIELTELKRRIDPQRLGHYLSSVYRLAILDNQIALFVNSQEVKPLKIPEEWQRETFEFEFFGGKKVKGWIGQIPEDEEIPKEIKPGIRGNVFGRLIADNLFFGHPTPETNPLARFLISEFNIDSEDLPLMTGKTDFDRSSTEWELLAEEIHQRLSPFIRQLLQDSEKPRVLRGDKPAFNDALFIIRHALVSIGELSHGINPPLKKGKSSERKTQSKKREYLPRTPRPEKAIGQRERLPLGGMVEIISRNLGPKTRSTICVKDGKKTSVINPNCREYRLARKDKKGLVRYILTRAAEEVAHLPPSGEDLSPNEYEKRVPPFQQAQTVAKYRQRVDDYNDEFLKAGNRSRLI